MKAQHTSAVRRAFPCKNSDTAAVLAVKGSLRRWRALDRCGLPPQHILIAEKAAKRTANQWNNATNRATNSARIAPDSRTNRARFVQKICAFLAESLHDSCRKRANFVHESGTELTQIYRHFGPSGNACYRMPRSHNDRPPTPCICR